MQSIVKVLQCTHKCVCNTLMNMNDGNMKTCIEGIILNGAFAKTPLSFQGDVGFRGLPGLPGPPGEGLQGPPVRLIFMSSDINSPMNLPDYSNKTVILNAPHVQNKSCEPHAQGVCLCCCGD